MTSRLDMNLGKDTPRVKVAAKADTPNVLPILLLVLGVVVLLISRTMSGI
jgi:hypothetical protein